MNLRMADASGGAPLPVEGGSKLLSAHSRRVGCKLDDCIFADEFVRVLWVSAIRAGIILFVRGSQLVEAPQRE